MSDDFNPNSTDAVLAKIFAKLENIETKQEEHHTEFLTRFTSVENDVEVLKQAKWKLSGIVVGLGFASHWVAKGIDFMTGSHKQ